MSDKLRDASVVAHEVCEEMEEYGPSFATKVIEADRQAVRTALVAEIAAWLREGEKEFSDCDIAAHLLETGMWKQ